MTTVELKNPSEISNLTPEKGKQLESTYRSFKKQVISQEKQLSTNQTDKLKLFIENIKSLNTKLATIRSECEKKHHKLTEEVKMQQKKLEGVLLGQEKMAFEENLKIKIADEKKKFVKSCELRVRAAESISYKTLKNIEIEERKSEANEVFKWIMVAMYIEPEGKYYWPNFKKQVISQNEALEDLKERLAKINAFSAKEEQKVKTNQFLQAETAVRAAPEFKGFEKDIEKIYEVAKIFQECINIGKRIKNYEHQLVENQKQQTEENDVLEQRRMECDALAEKMKVEELYLTQLKEVEKSLTQKIISYEREKEQAELYSKELDSVTTEVQLVTTVDQKETREKCECVLY